MKNIEIFLTIILSLALVSLSAVHPEAKLEFE